jgi:hypothetical protein
MLIREETKIPLRGDLRIIRRDAATLDILSVWEKKNVITFAGVESLVKLQAPNAAFGVNVQLENQIKSIRFGLSSVAPQRTDTNLISEAIVSSNPVRIALVDASRTVGAAGTVEYTATMTSGVGNGVTYREAGLFTRGTTDDPLTTSGATMFSRQVFSDQPKNSGVVLEFRWRITYTV